MQQFSVHEGVSAQFPLQKDKGNTYQILPWGFQYFLSGLVFKWEIQSVITGIPQRTLLHSSSVSHPSSRSRNRAVHRKEPAWLGPFTAFCLWHSLSASLQKRLWSSLWAEAAKVNSCTVWSWMISSEHYQLAWQWQKWAGDQDHGLWEENKQQTLYCLERLEEQGWRKHTARARSPGDQGTDCRRCHKAAESIASSEWIV